MVPETQTMASTGAVRRYAVVTKLAVAISVVELFSNGAAGLISEPEQVKPDACLEQACGQTALSNLLLAAIPPTEPSSTPVMPEVSGPKYKENIEHSATPAGKPSPKPSPTDIAVTNFGQGGDISFPQCRRVFDPKTKKHRWTYVAPRDVDFALVGLTDYKQEDLINPCLTEELRWGLKIGLRGMYANVRNPGNFTDPEVYGRNQAQYIVKKFMAAMVKAGGNPDPTKYEWWLDIEGGNDWDKKDRAANRAVAEGWAEYLDSRKIKFGLYSTTYMLAQLIGAIDTKASPKLVGRESWLPLAACSTSPLPTSPRVAMIQGQTVQRGNSFDINKPCKKSLR